MTPLGRAIVRIGQLTLLGRGAARRWLLKLLKERGIRTVKTEFRGVPFCFHLDNTTERQALFGRYNREELDLIDRFMSSEGSVFVDIGANSGLYTNYVTAKAPTHSVVIAIEPNPAMCARIRDNIGLLEPCVVAKKRVSIEQCAVSDHVGNSFLILETGAGSARLSDHEVGESIEVDVRTLLDIIKRQQVARIDALKIDVEGHEDKVLLPFFSEAPKNLYPRAIVIEHTSKTSWSVDLFELLPRFGYRVLGKTRGNTLLIGSS